MMVELNEVLLEGEPQTLSLMARERRITCLTSGTPERLTRWLHAIMGFVPVKSGYISIDGEPLTPAAAPTFRQLMSFAPAKLCAMGEIKTYEPPSVQDIFSLQQNRNLPISNGILGEEVRRVALEPTDQRAHLLAVTALLNRPVLLVDDALPAAADYLTRKAAEGRVVIVTSLSDKIVGCADLVVEI